MTTVHYLWDPIEDNIVREFDDAGALIAGYTTEPHRFGSVISQRRSGQSRFFHFDGLGSTLAVTDESQNVTDTRRYTAFGETTENFGGTLFPFQYIGEKGYYTDSVTGDLFVRRRQYSPRLVRWLSSDPREPFSRLQTYVYARNSPVVFSDPSGEAPPSPNLRIASKECLGCGQYDVRWQIEPSGGGDAMYFFQKLCFKFEYDDCSVSCAKCTPSGISDKGECCIIEWLGLGESSAGGGKPLGPDIWSYGGSKRKGDCRNKGFFQHSSTLFGVPTDSKDMEKIRKWPWKKLKGNADRQAFLCSKLRLEVGEYMDFEANKDLLKDVIDDKREIGGATVKSTFDCCPIVGENVGTLDITIQGGVEAGANRHTCGKVLSDPIPLK